LPGQSKNDAALFIAACRLPVSVRPKLLHLFHSYPNQFNQRISEGSLAAPETRAQAPDLQIKS